MAAKKKQVEAVVSTSTILCQFALEYTTPGAIRYQQVGADGKVFSIAAGAPVGTLYMRKSAFAGDPPEKLTVSIETAA
jgi:hypothetical protein